MITRHLASKLSSAARKYPVVSVTGPRQSGKTTLVRSVFPKAQYVSLEARAQGHRCPHHQRDRCGWPKVRPGP